jgi:hypothetical protein
MLASAPAFASGLVDCKGAAGEGKKKKMNREKIRLLHGETEQNRNTQAVRCRKCGKQGKRTIPSV